MLQEISSKIEINGISVVGTRATVMKDKGLGIFLKLLFGTGGIIILILAWAEPMALPERIFTVSIGFIGLSFALSRVISLIAGVTRR